MTATTDPSARNGGSGSAETALRRQWHWSLAVLVAVWAVLVALFYGTAASMVETWTASTLFGHCFLILPVCAYLVWQRKARLSGLAPQTGILGLPILVLLAMAWLLGEVTGTMVVQQFALVAMLVTAVITVLGWRIAKRLTFPLFFLFFMVPVGEFAIAPLQDVTAVFVVHMLQLTGIPVYSDGLFIHIPSGSFEVAEACAGVRFLISTIALGFIGANQLYRSTGRRLAFIALSFVVPIVANGFRAYGIVMLAHLSDFTIAVGVDHLTYGFIFLSIVTVILLGIGVTFREGAPAERRSGQSALPGAEFKARVARPVVAGAAYVMIALSAYASGVYTEPRVEEGLAVQLSPLSVQPPWMQVEVDQPAWQPRFNGADIEHYATYGDHKDRVDVYLAFYAEQRQGAEVINSSNYFADGRLWNRAGGGRIKAVIDGVSRQVNYVRMVTHRQGRVVWYWYWVDGRFTASPYVAKLLQAKARLLGGIRSAAVIAVAADYDDAPADARAVLNGFTTQINSVSAMLEQTDRRLVQSQTAKSDDILSGER